MKINYHLIAVFSDRKRDLRGNISAVILCEAALTVEDMKRIAADLNQPATTFMRRIEGVEGIHELRWFAPDAEIGLCGHGTAAAAAYLSMTQGDGEYKFKAGNHGLSGSAKSVEHSFAMAISAIDTLESLPIPEALREGLGINVLEHFRTGNKNIVLVESERELAGMKPDMAKLRKMQHFGYAVTAPGEEVDFVSRTLVPFVQQLEDHATGSSHAALVPFWAKRLGRNSLDSLQLSPRGGAFKCALQGEEVVLSGQFEVLAEGTYLL